MKTPISPRRALAEAILPAAGLLLLLPVLYRLADLPALSLLPAAQLWLMLCLGLRLRPEGGSRGQRAVRLAGWCLLAAVLFQAAYRGLGALLQWSAPLLQQLDPVADYHGWGQRWRPLFILWQPDRPFAAIAVDTLLLAVFLVLVWLLSAGARRVTAALWRRFEHRLQTTLTANFVLIAVLSIVLAQIVPAGLLVTGIYLGLPAEAEAGLYARRVADALTRQLALESQLTGEARREAAAGWLDYVMDGNYRHPPATTIEDWLLYTLRLPAGVTGQLRGLAWLSAAGEVRISRGTLGPDADIHRLPVADVAWRAVVASAAGGEEDAVANSRRVVASSGNIYHVGTAPMKDGTGQTIGIVMVWLQAGTLLGAPAELYTPLISFGMIALFLGAVGLIVLAPAGLIAALTGRRLARRIVGPVQALDEAARAMAEGDLSRRAAVASPDELGDLARQFNQMADRLQATLTALQDEKDKVARLARARQEMIANVSHDLRTPLASLTAYLESLESHPDRLADYLPILGDETARLARLVDDLFALARLDAGELELHLGPVDLKSLIGKTVAGFAPLAWHNRRVAVETALPDELPAAQADPQRVEQILANLLTNALRHTPEGGVITVAARDLGSDGVEVRVSDTGAGIAPEDLSHVFERFYRADPARSGGGAGLGLAIVKGLTEAQGGQVGVESTPDQGASFWFTLPVMQR